MKKEVNIPLQEIDDIIDAGQYFLSRHKTDPSNSEGLDPWTLIESMTNSLNRIFGDCISSYKGSTLPILKASVLKFQVHDKVEIIGLPIIRPETAMINYVGCKGVILEILDTGNYWVGITSSIPCAEFTEDSLKPIM